MLETITSPYRVATKLEKRREGEPDPYETLTTATWFEADGSEITDTERIAALEAAQRHEQE